MLIVRCKDGLFVVRWDLNGSALMAHQWYVSYTRALFFKPKLSVHPSTGHLIGQEFRLPKQQRHGMGTISAEKLYGRTKTELHTCGTIVRRTKGAKSTAQYAIAQAHLFRTLWGQIIVQAHLRPSALWSRLYIVQAHLRTPSSTHKNFILTAEPITNISRCGPAGVRDISTAWKIIVEAPSTYNGGIFTAQ